MGDFSAVSAVADKGGSVIPFNSDALIDEIPHENAEEAGIFVHKLKISVVAAAGVTHRMRELAEHPRLFRMSKNIPFQIPRIGIHL